MTASEGSNVRWVPSPEGYVPGTNDVPNAGGILNALGKYCKACYAVSRDIGFLSTERKPENKAKAHVVLWKVRLAELASSADGGCQFCGFFAIRFFTEPHTTFRTRGFRNSGVACCRLAPKGDEPQQLNQALRRLRKFLAECPSAEFTFLLEPLDYSPTELSCGRVRFSLISGTNAPQRFVHQLVQSMHIDIEVYALEGNIASKFVKTRPIDIQPGSDKSVEQARQWIDECRHQHHECPVPAKSTRPTRLVNILDDENLVLTECGDDAEKVDYVALSYCRQGLQPFTTTKSSYEQRFQGFKLSDVPKLFQDGIVLARRLGLQYIWIDSLCIIQDSDEDKERELPRTAEYFKSSYVTICAAAAETCHDGFLQTHDECQTHPGTGIPEDLLSMPFLDPMASVGEILFRESCPYALSWEPIERYAWTFQERVLSPRVLHYGTRTVWQCRHHQRSHGGVEDFSLSTRSFDYRKLQAGIRSGDGDRSASANAPNELYGLWHKAVREYGARELESEHDKLPAIAGLASEFAGATGDDYLAGLWRGNLLKDLLWSTWPNLELARPKERRAPTWSWASVDNDIRYDRLPPDNAEAIATVLICSATPLLAESAFGRNSDGALEIEGVLIRVNGEVIEKNLRGEYTLPGPDPSRGFATPFFLDMILSTNGKGLTSNDNWKPPERGAFLPLFAVESSVSGQHDVHGLVLEQREDGRWERIANFTNVAVGGLREMLRDLKEKIVIV